MGVVVDASAVLDLILRTDRYGLVRPTLLADDADLHAPAVLDVEVLMVLRRAESKQEIDASRAVEALEDLADLRIELHSNRPFLQRAWDLRANASAPDAIYLGLAEALGATLLTTDVRLGRAAQAIGVETIPGAP